MCVYVCEYVYHKLLLLLSWLPGKAAYLRKVCYQETVCRK